MKETFEEFMRRLHCSHVSFDDLAKWYFELKEENERLGFEITMWDEKYHSLPDSIYPEESIKYNCTQCKDTGVMGERESCMYCDKG